MHLKILFGLLTLGFVAASPKAAAKPAAKSSSQLFEDYPSIQPSYPGVSSQFGQLYAAQSFPGQQSVRFSSANYGSSFGYPGYGGLQSYSQAPAFNYYQSPQLIPVPVAYSSALTGNVQSANDYGAGKLYPKSYVSPAGSPSPAPVSSPVYYPSSTPSPVAYQSSGSYVNSYFGNSQIPVSTPSPIQAQELIPEPITIGSRSSFQPEIINYNIAPQSVAVSTPAPLLPSYQQSTPAPFLRTYQSSTAIPYPAYQQQTARTPYLVQYQQPTAAPLVSYQQQSTPAPIKLNYQQQSSPASYKLNYSYQQKPTPVTYKPTYQQQYTTAPYQVKYQTPAVSSRSPFATYQQSPTPVSYVSQYQQPASYSFGSQYSQPTTSQFSTNYQRLAVPAYQQYQFKSQPAQPTPTYGSVAPTASYSNVGIQSPQPINILSQSYPAKTVSIAERSFFPTSTASTPVSEPRATIIKSEYKAGTVSPQYNHISSYSTPSSFASVSNAYLPQFVGKSAYGYSYEPLKSYASYYPAQSYASSYPAQSYASYYPAQSYAGFNPAQSYASYYPAQSYASFNPAQSYASYYPSQSYASYYPSQSYASYYPSTAVSHVK